MRTGVAGGQDSQDSLPMTLEIFTTNNLKIIFNLGSGQIIKTKSHNIDTIVMSAVSFID